MPTSTATQALTYDDCLRHVAEDVFRFRPSDYQKKHPKWPGQVGLEIEMFAFEKRTLHESIAKLLPLFDGERSIASMLLKLAQQHPAWHAETDASNDDKLLRIVLEEGDQITFEPGGQVEFSSIPYPCLSDALDRMEKVQGTLRKGFSAEGVSLLQSGINPWQSVEEIGLQMAKSRYRAMDEHFTQIGPMGRRMMRQTATVQVNLDFGDCCETLAKRYIAANLLAPYATALFAYSPQVNGIMSDTLCSTRAEAWRQIDGDRTGIPNLDRLLQNRTKAQCVQIYLDWLLDAAVIFIESLHYERPAKRLTFRSWLTDGYKGTRPTMNDFKIHLSLHFPEVRARGFLELRSVDCQARPWQSVPAAFYSAILYVDRCLDQVLKWLEPDVGQLNTLLKAASFGLHQDQLRSRGKDIMALALEGFSSLPPCFQGEGTRKAFAAFARQFTEKGRCPADDLRDLARQGPGVVTGDMYEKLEDRWYQSID